MRGGGGEADHGRGWKCANKFSMYFSRAKREVIRAVCSFNDLILSVAGSVLEMEFIF